MADDERKKRCSRCKLMKPVKDFYRRTKSRDGLSYLCKTCDHERRRQYPRTH